MKFLIFGSTGFVGRHLQKFLEAQGDEVIGISRSGQNKSVSLDISKPSEFDKISFKPDVVVNCASQIPVLGKTSKDPDFLKQLFSTNVIGGANIANWAVQQKVFKIINCSTLAVIKKPWPVPLTENEIGLPEGVHVGYGMSKLSQEQIMNQCVKDSTTSLVHARLSAVYGLGMTQAGLIFNVLQKLKNQEPVQLSNASKNFLDLVHVEDVAKSISAIAKTNSEEKIVNIASAEEVSVMELTQKLKDLAHSDVKIINEDTAEESSRAKVDIQILKEILRSNYKKCTPLDRGLSPIVKDFLK